MAAGNLLAIRIRPTQKRRGGLGARPWDVLALVAAICLIALHANPFTNTRFVSAAALGSLAIAWFRPLSSRAGALVFGAAIGAVVLLYPLANTFRYAHGTTYETGFSAYAGMDFDGFQQTINTLSFVSDEGHTNGLHTTSAVLFMVPRSIWSGKAMPASIDVAAHHGYQFTNLSLPFSAEMYLEFGGLGMVVAVAVVSYAGGRLDNAWVSGRATRISGLVPYAALSTLSVIRGPLGANAPVYLTTLGLIFLGLRSVPATDHADIDGRPCEPSGAGLRLGARSGRRRRP